MFNKNYITIPFFVGLTIIGFKTADAILDSKKDNLLGKDKFLLCDTSKTTCVAVKEREKIPIKYSKKAPLGLATAVNKSEINCLARNITQEAKDNLKDRIIVGYGTINRVLDGGYGKTICQVIAQKNAMSWYKDPIKRKRPPTKKNVILAKKILSGEIENPFPDCPYVSWYNEKKDSKSSYNYKNMNNPNKKKCVYKPFNTPHFYIGWR